MSRRARPSHHLFRVSPHGGVWRLIHNGVFSADYASEADACGAAHAAARAQTALGHTVQIATPERLAPDAAPVAASTDE